MTTRKAIAHKLGVSVSTMRKYERLARRLDVLETPPGVKRQGHVNEYTPADVRVFVTIDRLRRVEKQTYPTIEAAGLLNALAETPEPPVETPADAERDNTAGSAETALVPFSRLLNVTSALSASEATLATVSDERDRLQSRLDEKDAALLEATSLAAAATAALDELRRSSRPFWRRWFGQE